RLVALADSRLLRVEVAQAGSASHGRRSATAAIAVAVRTPASRRLARRRPACVPVGGEDAAGPAAADGGGPLTGPAARALLRMPHLHLPFPAARGVEGLELGLLLGREDGRLLLLQHLLRRADLLADRLRRDQVAADAASVARLGLQRSLDLLHERVMLFEE